ncbi:sensor histidine kinase [Thalassotalea ganghwensis]
MNSRPIKTTSFEDNITRFSLILALLPSLLLCIFLLISDVSIYLKIILLLFVFTVIAIGHLLLWRKLRNQLRTTTNVVEALITGDTSMRPNSKVNSGALAELNLLLNKAAIELSEQRLLSKEHHLAMAKVIEHINVAVVCFDQNAAVTLLNPKAKQLLQVGDDVIGMPAKLLGIDKKLLGNVQQKVVTLNTQHIEKKVYLQTDTYRLHGEAQTLLFINDVQQLLQNEERIAWQRLLRVMSHEINNSLAPIASIGESLGQIVAQPEISEQQKTSLIEGLSIMTNRALTLDRFIKEYQSLTRLPQPTKTLFSLKGLLEEHITLFNEANVSLIDSKKNADDIEVYADRTQLAQVLVNLLKNAQQSFQDTTGEIVIDWRVDYETLTISICDNGKGISNPENLFVPFYTTKKQGSGIGLVLSRQIMFNHDGDLTLKNNQLEPGATALVTLPIITA